MNALENAFRTRMVWDECIKLLRISIYSSFQDNAFLVWGASTYPIFIFKMLLIIVLQIIPTGSSWITSSTISLSYLQYSVAFCHFIGLVMAKKMAKVRPKFIQLLYFFISSYGDYFGLLGAKGSSGWASWGGPATGGWWEQHVHLAWNSISG